MSVPLKRPAEKFEGGEIAGTMRAIGANARAAARRLATLGAAEKQRAIEAMAHAIRAAAPAILAANNEDVAEARKAGATSAFIDRLRLDEKRIAAMADGVDTVAALPDPVGTVIAGWDRPNGMRIERVRVPLGVIGIIYESRPNVTADAGALGLKAGNAVILRGGSDSFRSSGAIHAAIAAGLAGAGVPETAIQVAPTRDRDAVGLMLKGLDGAIDVIVPRGGKGLVARVQAEARVPVFAHLDGIATSTWTRPPTLKWPDRSCAIPRCGARASVAPPKRCWSTKPPPRRSLRRWCACSLTPDAKCAAIARLRRPILA